MKKPNDWYDVDDILYDGTKEEIEKIICPNCGGKIQYKYGEQSRSFEIRCLHCGHISRANGTQKPNCAIIFGNEYEF